MIIDEKILQLMGENWSTIEEISVVVGISEVTTTLALKQLTANYSVMKLNGRYRRVDCLGHLESSLFTQICFHRTVRYA